jgi:hypothetical protein
MSNKKTQLLQACDRLRTRLESPLVIASRLVFSVCRVDPCGGNRQAIDMC